MAGTAKENHAVAEYASCLLLLYVIDVVKSRDIALD